MKILDQFIASFFPKFAVRRMQARSAIRNYYEAAKINRLHKTVTANPSGDQTTRTAASVLRAKARELDENYDVASGVLDVLVNNIVGSGIIPQPQIKNKDGSLARDLNKQVLKLWWDWYKNPEVTKELSYSSVERLVCRTWLRDGEVFLQHLEGKVSTLNHGTTVPYSVELLEADMVPHDLEDPNKGLIQGVTKNAWGQPTFYTVYKKHPGDYTAYAIDNASNDVKLIPANKVLHLKFIKRVRQTRGVSIFANVINRFDDIKDIEESERVAARVAAAMTGFIQKGSPDFYVAPETDEEYRDIEMMPGMIFDDLNPGEQVGTIASNRPNNDVVSFIDANLRRAAAGTGASYSSISKDYNGSYSSQRQELVESYLNYGSLWSEFKENLSRPVYEKFVQLAFISGLLDIDSSVDTDSLFDASYSRPALLWVDPQKELAAIEKEISLNLNSKSAIMRDRGRNPDEVREKIAEERRLENELGISGSPQPSQPESEEENEQVEESEEEIEKVDEDSEENTEGEEVENSKEVTSIPVGTLVELDDGYILRKVENGYITESKFSPGMKNSPINDSMYEVGTLRETEDGFIIKKVRGGYETI